MRFYHRTSTEAAQAILREGFRDTTGTYMTDEEFTGVWVSERPLDCNEGAWGDVVLQIELEATAEELADFEWVEEGKPHREWLVPASLLNGRGKITVEEAD